MTEPLHKTDYRYPQYPPAEKDHEGPCCATCLKARDYPEIWHEGTGCCCKSPAPIRNAIEMARRWEGKKWPS